MLVRFALSKLALKTNPRPESFAGVFERLGDLKGLFLGFQDTRASDDQEWIILAYGDVFERYMRFHAVQGTTLPERPIVIGKKSLRLYSPCISLQALDCCR